MAENDQYSREIINKLSKDQKKKWQEENRKRLTMKKYTPKPPETSQPEIKLTIVQRAVEKVRGLFSREYL